MSSVPCSLSLVLLFSILLTPATALALALECSTTNQGRVVLNEVYSGGGGAGSLEFVEIYFRQPTNIDGWKLYYHSNKDVVLTLGEGENEATAYLPSGNHSSDNNCPVSDCPSSATTFPTGAYIVYKIKQINPNAGEFLLVDTSAALISGSPVVVDYLAYYSGSYTPYWNVAAGCRQVLSPHDASNKDLARIPNGSGNWADNGNSISQGTSNDAGALTLDHLRLLHDGVGLTCTPEEITIRACADAACTTLYPGSVTTTLSPSGWVGGNTITFSGSTSAALRKTTTGAVTLGAANTSPAPISSATCSDGGAETCVLTFYDSGFVFDVPTPISGKTSNTVTINAVRKDAISQQCVPAFANVGKTVNFWSTYDTPASGSLAVAVNSTQVATSGSTGTGVNLTFDVNGQASITVNYPDAGRMQLDAKYTGAGSEAGLVMLGNDTFVVKPAGLCLFSTDTAGCPAGDATCDKFKKAGEAFNLTVRAARWESDTDTDYCNGNATTPNFQLADIALSQTLLAPAGGETGSLSVSSLDITADGQAAVNQTVSEVGVFTFTATPPVYWGETIAPATSANIGRFIPDHFSVTISPDPPLLVDACSSGPAGFTYLGQSFSFATNPTITVTAQNASNATTQNYQGAFWWLGEPFSFAYTYADPAAPVAVAPVAGTLTAPAGATATCPGTLTLTLADAFTYTRPPVTAPQAPFAASINLAIAQGELTDTDAVCFDTGTGCQGFTRPAITGAHLRHGRGIAANAFGPETSNLSIPVTLQFYNGAAWVANTLDNICTSIATTPAGPPTWGDIQLTNYIDQLSEGETIPSFAGFVNGVGFIILSGPGADNYGSVDLSINVPNWLEPDPSAQAFFGAFRGNDRIINWREIMR